MKKTKRVEFRMTRAEKARWRVAATLDGRTLSDWVRRVANGSAMSQDDLDDLRRSHRAKRAT